MMNEMDGRKGVGRPAVLLLSGLLLSACSSSPRGSEGVAETPVTDSREDVPMPVQVSRVSLETVHQMIRLTGTATPWDSFSVSSEIAGRVALIRVAEGQFVSQGELLLELDREKRLLELQSRQAELARARVDLDFGLKNLERGRALLERGAVSKAEVDSLEQAVERARASLELARIAVDLMDQELRDSRIEAPVAGQVWQRHVSLGETINPTQPLFTLIQVDPIKVTSEISESDLPTVRKGAAVQLTLDALPEETFEGRIHRVHPVANTGSGAFPVEISLSNPEHRVQAGMMARLQIEGRSYPGALTVPLDAVVELKQEYCVFVVRENIARREAIQIVRRVGDRAIVTGSLQPGDLVVTRGSSNLTDGTSVEIVS